MQNEPPSRQWRLPPLVALPLAAVALFAVISLATRPLGGEPQPSFFVIGSVAPGVQVGQVAPGTARAGGSPLILADLDGAPISLGDFAPHPIWLMFWKTACPPCEAEAADVAAAFDSHRSQGLVLIAVDVWDTIAVVRDYTRAHPPDYPVAVDESAAYLDAYGVWGAPTHYFIGADGIIRDRYFGPMTSDLIERSLASIVSAAGR
jgi:cytochrome c biogenesis protein CcmG, thiol:disulfide interchange protein DsbE